ncbi:TolB family protein [Flagellimonas meishanensis]|uniref:TolB family protein n=1 Tax=Flagellimonas meishanensis TaxID=2873264 RepID=UPI001CA6AB56|nr:hypothetical protein [[Muricauda] meishanensis]
MLLIFFGAINFLFTQVAEVKEIEKITNIESSYPYWSPDGKKIVFQSDRLDNDTEIYVMNVDGSNLERLTFVKGFNGSPIWSTNGKHIVFSSMRDGGNHDIFIMKLDGSEQRNLTNHPAYDGHPNFPPDGQRIIFNSNRIMGLENYEGSVFTRDSNVELY